MQPQLDFKKPYAHVYGHEAAAYEQGGQLFTGSGDPVIDHAKPVNAESPKPKKKEIITEEIHDDGSATILTEEQAFLVNLLTGTAMAKSTVVSEATKHDYSWHDVQQAAFELGVSTYMQGKKEMWKLTDDR